MWYECWKLYQPILHYLLCIWFDTTCICTCNCMLSDCVQIATCFHIYCNPNDPYSSQIGLEALACYRKTWWRSAMITIISFKSYHFPSPVHACLGFLSTCMMLTGVSNLQVNAEDIAISHLCSSYNTVYWWGCSQFIHDWRHEWLLQLAISSQDINDFFQHQWLTMQSKC